MKRIIRIIIYILVIAFGLFCYYWSYLLRVNLDYLIGHRNTEPMEWIKIDRDENGFAASECLDEIAKHYYNKAPILVAYDNDLQNYDVIAPAHDIGAWIGDIELHPRYTHYLPIPKLEV